MSEPKPLILENELQKQRRSWLWNILMGSVYVGWITVLTTFVAIVFTHRPFAGKWYVTTILYVFMLIVLERAIRRIFGDKVDAKPVHLSSSDSPNYDGTNDHSKGTPETRPHERGHTNRPTCTGPQERAHMPEVKL